MSKLAELRETLTQKRAAYHELYQKNQEDLTDEVLGELDTLRTEIIGIDGELTKLENADKAAKDNEAAMKVLNDPVNAIAHPSQVQEPQPQTRKTIGQQFVENDNFRQWHKNIAPGGVISSERKGFVSPPVEVKDLITGAGATSGGAFVLPDFQPGLTELGRRPLVMRDIITVGQTDSDTVDFVRVTDETSAAAVVAEATATGGASGLKPESALAFERVQEPVKTVAHWVPITKRALADAGQLRTYIDNFLRDGLEQVLEDQMVTGDGTGEDFVGIGSTTGVQTQAFDTDIVTTARKARTLVRINGRAVPNAYLLNPVDWEKIDLLQDGEARYYYGGPQNLGVPRLWSLPVVESEAVPEGTGYVGDFRQCVLWDRQSATIQATDSHADFFVRNMVAILAELRAAFGVLKPQALVEMALEAGP